ncbi:hypothetical protein CA54_08900 [Symmachiella macrocystis]|uniref:Uncharacterized protein n=1 Tax=Symmachiella macrocystis TaxID=2527985 RepID=A0A5C6BIT9_9PLAN|nr:hypothetical protein CA54_08900 [Symmachiella macrocystis]
MLALSCVLAGKELQDSAGPPSTHKSGGIASNRQSSVGNRRNSTIGRQEMLCRFLESRNMHKKSDGGWRH